MVTCEGVCIYTCGFNTCFALCHTPQSFPPLCICTYMHTVVYTHNKQSFKLKDRLLNQHRSSPTIPGLFLRTHACTHTSVVALTCCSLPADPGTCQGWAICLTQKTVTHRVTHRKQTHRVTHRVTHRRQTHSRAHTCTVHVKTHKGNINAAPTINHNYIHQGFY